MTRHATHEQFTRRSTTGPTAPGLVTYTTAGDPTCARSARVPAGARPRRRRRARGRRAVLGSAGRRPGHSARDRAGAGGGRRRSRACWRSSRRCARSIDAPIVIFSYANPVAAHGLRALRASARRGAGVDGVLALDLPIEEAGRVSRPLATAGLDTIFLLSPTTTDARIAQAAALGSGLPLRHLAARRHRRARPGRGGRRRARRRASAARRRCRSRSASGFRGRSTSPEVGALCRRGRRRQRARAGDRRGGRSARSLVTGVEAYVRWLKGASRVDAARGG